MDVVFMFRGHRGTIVRIPARSCPDPEAVRSWLSEWLETDVVVSRA